MTNIPKKFGTAIPEVRDFIIKFACRLSDKPQFVLIGQYNSKEIGPIMGLLAAADNQFSAYLLRREFRKNGICDIARTEHHPDGNGTFSVEKYKTQMRAKIEKKRIEQKEAE